jgi:hypothetical protein
VTGGPGPAQVGDYAHFRLLPRAFSSRSRPGRRLLMLFHQYGSARNLPAIRKA